MDCSNLWHLTLPPVLLRVEADAFSGVHSPIDLPDSIRNFSLACCGSDADLRRYANGLDRLRGREFPIVLNLNGATSSDADRDTVLRHGTITLRISGSTCSIREGEFKNAPHLKKLTVTDGMSGLRLGESSFEGSGLRDIDFGRADIREFPSYVFHHNVNLRHLLIPSSVVTVGPYAFSCCSSLSTVVFATPSSLETIMDGSFANTHLSTISFPSQLKNLKPLSFQNCACLSHVVFSPLSKVFIEHYAFTGTDLRFLYLPPDGRIEWTAAGKNKYGTHIQVVRPRVKSAEI
jgi:hypothetical protein